MSTPSIAIVGLGLLGASLAEVVRLVYPKAKIVGISSANTLEKALSVGLIDEGFSYEDFSYKSKADLIFLCTPMEHIANYMRELAENPQPFKADAVITDVGSAKKTLCELGKKLFARNAYFVGSHPMAGSEKSGFEARSALLYESALWILCEDEKQVSAKAPLLIELLKGMNVRLVHLDPETHDRYVARISHMPQLVSTTLSHSLRRSPQAPAISGPGFRDMTRLAASPLWMWEPILKENTTEILNALMDFKEDIDQLIAVLEDKNWKSLPAIFESAQNIRASIPHLKHKLEKESYPVLVSIPNKPGMLNRILEPVAQQGLNFSDIELLKNREGLGGTLRLVFDKEADAEKAVDLICSLEVQARLL